MPQLLLELFSEEIPARMQAQAARDLERMMRDALAKAGLTPESLTAYAGPRRLTLVAEGLPTATPDREEELKGPRANAPEQALDGFLRKTGLSRAELIEREGVFFATMTTPGRTTADVIAEAVPQIMASFPWPKSMRSGVTQFRWVRPLKRILCLFDGRVVEFGVNGINSSNLTEGHRFMGPLAGQAFPVRDFKDYQKQLSQIGGGCVVIDARERRDTILGVAQAECDVRGLELVLDEGLADEVSGLSEWPIPLIGDMDSAFLDLPAEVIRTSMRTHQKYFAVRKKGETSLAPHFVVVANIVPTDGGALIKAGNAKVLSARLNDARFFWDQDRAPGAFDKWLGKLKGVTFHAKLGTLAQRVGRIAALSRTIARTLKVDPTLAEDAARYCKADLASGMVGEFPELQGIMGGYYAREQGFGVQVCDAIRDHYKPVGPSDSVPTAPLTVVVALADKLDTLVGFFAIDEKPTGSKDPYALRRAALGVIRIVLENEIRLPLNALVGRIPVRNLVEYGERFDVEELDTLLAFFADRLKVLLRDEGKRHDLVDAVFALGDDDLVRITRRVEALSGFLAAEDGANLLAGYKRATNILKAEAKKTPDEVETWSVNPEAGTLPEERALAEALRVETGAVDAALEAEDFTRAMTRLAHLRAPVDAFFDKVLVNDPDPAVRLTRLRLLTQVRDTANRVADFSLISG